jgi:aldehyde dehydrogenase (NAD+)
MADKFEGTVHNPPLRGVALAMNEPVGVVGIIAPDELPLLGLVSLIAPALAMGNTVVAVPSQRWPLLATDLYQVFETSDLPPGSINIVTGRVSELALVLARHDDVDGLWVVADGDTCRIAELESVGNLKRVWTNGGKAIDWRSEEGEGPAFLRRAIEVKNIWIPYGD